jgi:hypothetical protein
VDVGGDVIGLDETAWTLPRLRPSRLRPGAMPRRFKPACLPEVARRPDGSIELRQLRPELTVEAAVRASTAEIVSRDAVGQPGGNLRLRLETAYMSDIEGWSSMALRDYLGLRDRQLVGYGPDGEDKWRSRSADRIRRDGRRDWAWFGAWPWAVFEDGALPPNWRDDANVACALAEWHRLQRRRLQARSDALRRLLRTTENLHARAD